MTPGYLVTSRSFLPYKSVITQVLYRNFHLYVGAAGAICIWYAHK